MRTFAWLIVLGVFIFSVLCFVVSFQVSDASTPQAPLLRDVAIALGAFVPRQAGEGLTYVASKCSPANVGVVFGFTSAAFGVLSLVILAATRRRPERNADEDVELIEDDDETIARIRRL